MHQEEPSVVDHHVHQGSWQQRSDGAQIEGEVHRSFRKVEPIEGTHEGKAGSVQVVATIQVMSTDSSVRLCRLSRLQEHVHQIVPGGGHGVVITLDDVVLEQVPGSLVHELRVGDRKSTDDQSHLYTTDAK